MTSLTLPDSFREQDMNLSPLAAAQQIALPFPTQRWRQGREHWRVDRDEGFRKADYAADIISDGVARTFVVKHHYSGSYPIARERVGLFRGTELVGVAVFSIPINNSVVSRYTGLDASEGVELGRFVLLDEVPYNAETFFLAKSFAVLRQCRPDLKTVIAYSDPLPRQTQNGGLVMPGHVGTIYQASNARYMGRASSKTLHLNRDGIALSSRAISKVRLQEHGASSAEKRLVRLGAPARGFAQDPGEWIDELLSGPTFKRVRHPGNHVYAWPLGTPAMKRARFAGFSAAMEYPKAQDRL
jgi:hypothetical protein